MTRILIVEDSPTQAETLRQILENAGTSPLVARDGEEALGIVAREPIDLVVSDIVMPGMSGYDLCKEIKGDPASRHVPVILLTSLKSPMDIIQGLECGADNFLTKPYDAEHLVTRIHNFLGNRQLRASQKFSLGIDVLFLGRQFNITSEKEQILDLLISTFEDIVRTNRRLETSRAELTSAKLQVEEYARKLEDRVQASEERYRRLFDSATDAILVIDIQTNRIVDASASAGRLFRRPSNNLHGFDEAALPWEGGTTLRSLYAGDAAASPAIPQEMRLLWADGTAVDVEVSGGTLEYGGQQPFQAVIRDVTDHRRADRALRESTSRLDLALRSTRMGIMSWNIEDERFELDNSARQLFGLEEAVLDLPSFMECLVPDDRPSFAQALQGALMPSGSWQVEFRIQAGAGRERRLQGRGDVARDANGRALSLTCICIDITEQRAAEQALAQAQKMQAVGHLTGGIAHDFNNLLAIIIGNCDMVMDTVRSDPEVAALVEMALDAALKGADLTERLLTFSRRQILEPTVLDLNGLVQGMQPLLSRTLGENISLSIGARDPLPTIVADRARLESVLLNLAVNARDAMPGGGILTIKTAEARLEAGDAKWDPEVTAGDYVILSVTDTGTGMSPDILAKVFQPFFTTKEQGKGSGLGLSMVYGFAKQSGGHVKLESAVGQGTTVALYLPKVQEAAVPAPASEPTQETGARERSATILLVEDNDDVRRVAVRQLRSFGYAVIAAHDAAAALEEIEKDQVIDLLFTDVMMAGGMDGRELAEEAVRRRRGLRVLLTSGFAQRALEGTAKGTLSFPMITKPYRQHDLARRLDEIFEGALA